MSVHVGILMIFPRLGESKVTELDHGRCGVCKQRIVQLKISGTAAAGQLISPWGSHTAAGLCKEFILQHAKQRPHFTRLANPN